MTTPRSLAELADDLGVDVDTVARSEVRQVRVERTVSYDHIGLVDPETGTLLALSELWDDKDESEERYVDATTDTALTVDDEVTAISGCHSFQAIWGYGDTIDTASSGT